MVCPQRIFNALKFLKSSGNPFYQQIQTREEYEQQCLLDDPNGYAVIFGAKTNERLLVVYIDDEAIEPILSLKEFLPIRKYVVFQIVYRNGGAYFDTDCVR